MGPYHFWLVGHFFFLRVKVIFHRPEGVKRGDYSSFLTNRSVSSLPESMADTLQCVGKASDVLHWYRCFLLELHLLLC